MANKIGRSAKTGQFTTVKKASLEDSKLNGCWFRFMTRTAFQDPNYMPDEECLDVMIKTKLSPFDDAKYKALLAYHQFNFENCTQKLKRK